MTGTKLAEGAPAHPAIDVIVRGHLGDDPRTTRLIAELGAYLDAAERCRHANRLPARIWRAGRTIASTAACEARMRIKKRKGTYR